MFSILSTTMGGNLLYSFGVAALLYGKGAVLLRAVLLGYGYRVFKQVSSIKNLLRAECMNKVEALDGT